MKLIPPDQFSHCIDNRSNLQNTVTSHKSNIHDISTSVINNLVHDHFQLAIINCRSIVNKQDELQALIISEEIDLILGTEYHLDDSITNSEVFPANFSVYRKDSNRHRGGVFIPLRNNMSSFIINASTPIEIIYLDY